MKKPIYILLFSLIFSCKPTSTSEGFVISGNIDGVYTDYIYLNYEDNIDSTLVVDNTFEFKGNLKTPVQGWINLRKPSSIGFMFLENSTISINIKAHKEKELNRLKITKISGSKTALIQEDYKTFYQKNQAKSNFKKLLFNKLDSLFTKHPKHPFSGTVLGEIALLEPVFNFNEVSILFQKLDTTNFNSDIKEMLNQGLTNLDKFGIGKPFPNVDLPNQNNEKISLNRFKGKITLIDFWASWCAPCRDNHPKLIKLYEDSEKLNFEILSVSIDSDSNKWINAIAKDRLTWPNVLDKEKNLYNTLGIFAIPTSYLIDENGILLGKNLSLNDIKAILQK